MTWVKDQFNNIFSDRLRGVLLQPSFFTRSNDETGHAARPQEHTWKFSRRKTEET